MNVTETRSRWIRTGGVAAIALAFLLLTAAQSDAAMRSFSKRFSTSDHGDIVLIGNTLMTCPSSTAACASAQAGAFPTGDARLNNNSYTMVSVDIDSDPTTTNSSSADLSIPSGSTVLWAGLYWSSQSASSARSQVLFQTPAAFGYVPLTASQADFDATVPPRYSCFAEVTALVRAGGNGTYAMANVQGWSGNVNTFAGWSLVVVFQNNALHFKNLSVYDGYQLVTNTNSINIPISGFLTPLYGPIQTRLGIMTAEGDRGYTGDYYGLNGTNLSDATRPVDNMTNSSITDVGVQVAAKNPNYNNQLGFDIARMNVPAGVVKNGDTSAVIRATSTNDQYYPSVITFATDLYVPIVSPNIVKTITDLNGGNLVPGDRIRFTVTMSNTGYDASSNLVLTDNIPAYTTFVPGSLQVLSGANTGVKSDGSGDDQAEYIPIGTPQVVFRLGAGANGSNGGTLLYTESTSLAFDVTLNSGVPDGTVLTNAVSVSYTGQTIGTTYSGTSSAATALVTVPPQISKSFAPDPIDAGGVSVLRIEAHNPSGNQTTLTGVSFGDTYPAGLVNASPANASVSCTPGSTFTSFTGGAAGGNSIGLNDATLAPNGTCVVTVNVTSAAMGNYVNTTGSILSTNSGTGGTATATLSAGKPTIALMSFTPDTIISNGTTTLSFTLWNPTASGLTNVAFTDTLANMAVASVPSVTNTCGGTVTAAPGTAAISLTGGSLAASGSCTLTVRVTSGTPGIQSNTASGVTSNESGAAGLPSDTAYLTVFGAPTAAMNFSPSSIGTTGSALLTTTISNPNSSLTVTGVSFTNSYPASQATGTIPNATLSCTSGSSGALSGGTAGGSAIGLTNGILAPGGSCTVSVNVFSGTPGNYLNSTGSIVSANSGTGAAVTATLNVTNLTLSLLSSAFTPTIVASNVTSRLTITLQNSSATTAITGVGFADNYPYGLSNASPPNAATTCPGGTVTAAAGGTLLSLSTATVPFGATAASRQCSISVNVTSSLTGTITHTIPAGAVTSANGGVNAIDSTATLIVLGPPEITKTFASNTIASGGTSTLTVVVKNPATNPRSLTGVAFTDNYPSAALTNAAAAAKSCAGGAVAGAIGASSLSLTGVTLASGASCTVTVRVTSAAVGNYVNTTGAVSSSNGGIGGTAAAGLSVGQPGITKAFSPSTTINSLYSTLTVTLTNPTGSPMTAAAFTDTYPVGMTNANPSNANTTCAGGTVSAAPGGNAVSLSGGTIPANSTCRVTVQVLTTLGGINTIPAGALMVSGGASNGTAAVATLALTPPPAVTVTFGPSSIITGGTATLAVTLTNANNFDLTGASFIDTYPANLTNSSGLFTANTCTGTITAAASGSSLSLSNGTIPANGSCTVGIRVTSGILGSYLDTSGGVATANGGTGDPAGATLIVMGPPAVSMAFAPTMAKAGDPSILSITLTNPNAQAITGTAFIDTYPVNLVNDAAPNASTSCTGGTVTAAPGGTSLVLSGGTIAANSSCSVTVTVMSALDGSYLNNSGPVTTTNAGSGTTAASTLLVATGVVLSGTVYADTNHNRSMDGGEAGIGLMLFVKAVPRSGLVCNGPALAAAAADPATGVYTLNGVVVGDYCLVLDTSATLADSTPTLPAGWSGSEIPGGIRFVTAGANGLSLQNFGLYYGSTLTGRVFLDIGSSGGTANDGVVNGTEAGAGGVLVRLANDADTVTYDSATTDGSGYVTLRIPGAVATGTFLKVIETNAAGMISTGAAAGTTGGTYVRTGDTMRFSVTAGTNYTGIAFGDVPDNQFLADGSQTALKGTIAYYAHSFTAGSAGSVTFLTTALASPAMAGWSEVLYQDSNCNGQLNAGEPQTTAAIALTAGQQVCILVKEFVPAGAPLNAQNTITVSAQFTYGNASPPLIQTLVHTDVTIVGQQTSAGLVLTKAVDKTTALPGATITYTITYANQSQSSLSNIVVHDGTPAFCSFVSSGCGPLPLNLTTCDMVVDGSGQITWTLGGTLAAGGSGTLMYTVQVQN